MKNNKRDILMLESSFKSGMCILKSGGPRPYLWVGSNVEYGYVPDKSVKKLRRLCDEILKKRGKS